MFTQGSDAFSGLTNTDLRPRRGRRPVPLLDLTWPIRRRRRRKGEPMRKQITDLVGTLNESVSQIAASGREDRDELLTKSFQEFNGALLEQLAEVLPMQEEPLEKGLNHIATFADAVRRYANTVNALKTGRPSYMISDSSDNGDRETLPDELAAMMDQSIHVGVLTLQAMVNHTAMLPEDEDALKQADQAGRLAKVEMVDGTEIAVETDLPEEYHELLTDPVELAAGYADAARAMTDQALAIAGPIVEQDPEAAEQLQEAYPELFDQSLGKAFPPKKPTTADEDGADPADPTTADGEEPTDVSDTPQDPIEMITRLASIIVVVAGSLQQGAAAGTATDPRFDQSGSGAAAMPLARQADGPVTLAKINEGEIEIDPELAGALDELDTLRAQQADLGKRFEGVDLDALHKAAAAVPELKDQLEKLRAAHDRLTKVAAPPKGAITSVTMGKGADIAGTSADAESKAKLAELMKSDPEAASRELIKQAQRNGRPLVEFS